MKIVGVTWSVIALIIAITPNSTEEKSLTITAEAEATIVPAVKQELKTVVDEKKIKEDKEKEEAKIKLAAENKAKAEQKAKEENKVAVLEFEKGAYALEDEIKPFIEYYQKAMAGLGDGSVDIFTAYEATEKARDAAKYVQSEFYSLAVPENLPKDVKKMLNEAKSDLSTAYYTKKEAFEIILKFLDDQKPSHMSKFKEEIQLSDAFVMSGVTKILEAKIAVGIELVETE
ncbi:hypothetical protein [Paenibacillus sinopodophylli]|uniref:hypothetical protein n=1 Tax=Paenibacillus sinopodophylli TaxID=1837342 RepID=UPI00110CBC38|nr:hypothetical protein [Paenibacillus sinopodophylli]